MTRPAKTETTAVVAIYAVPERYPPTLNAIERLSHHFDRVVVVCFSDGTDGAWTYPTNCKLVRLSAPPARRSLLKPISALRKLRRFVATLADVLRLRRPGLLLCYDDIAAYCGASAKQETNFDGVFWYHNHDAAKRENVSRFTSLGIAMAGQKNTFASLDVFSLPALDRLQYFDLTEFKGEQYWLPNYPELAFYSRFGSRHHELSDRESIKMIYQGALQEGHLFESIIPLLNKHVNSRPLSLTLVGPIADRYRRTLKSIAASHGTIERLRILPPVPYSVLPYITMHHTIGLATHEPRGIIYATGATASNKIYECGALGLPTLAYDTEHYREHLSSLSWINFVSKDPVSILAAISNHCDNYAHRSGAAYADFQERLNFAKYFDKVIEDKCLVGS